MRSHCQGTRRGWQVTAAVVPGGLSCTLAAAAPCQRGLQRCAVSSEGDGERCPSCPFESTLPKGTSEQPALFAVHCPLRNQSPNSLALPALCAAAGRGKPGAQQGGEPRRLRQAGRGPHLVGHLSGQGARRTGASVVHAHTPPCFTTYPKKSVNLSLQAAACAARRTEPPLPSVLLPTCASCCIIAARCPPDSSSCSLPPPLPRCNAWKHALRKPPPCRCRTQRTCKSSSRHGWRGAVGCDVRGQMRAADAATCGAWLGSSQRRSDPSRHRA